MTNEHVLVLRICKVDMTSRDNFKWPTSGYVEAHDWEPTPACGNGLHGWLHGHGNGDVSNYWKASDKWLVVKVNVKDMINLDGKVKFKCGEVVFCGDRKSATDYLLANDPIAHTNPVIGAYSIKDNYSTACTGYLGISLSGFESVSNSGYHGISVSGIKSSSISGNYGTSVTSNHSSSLSGHDGISVSGNVGKAISGNCGISLSGHRGNAASGIHGTSITGVEGTARSGDYGNIIIGYYLNKEIHYKVGHIGEDGLLPNVLYKLDDDLNFIPVEK